MDNNPNERAICSLTNETLRKIIANEYIRERRLAAILNKAATPIALDEYMEIHQRLVYYQGLLNPRIQKPRIEIPDADQD